MADLTLEDIAKQTGVSRSTVSRVVNNHPNVRDDVRKRVLEVIQITGYQPNAAARTLASQRSWTLGFVLPLSVSFFFTDPFFSHLTKGIIQACNQHNYTLALFLADTKEDEKQIIARISRKGLLDGVLVQAGHHGDQQIVGALIDADMPQVIIGRPFRSDNVNYVDTDNFSGSHNAVTHLIQLGHKRIGTVTGPLESTVGLDRKAGYIKALSECGYKVEDALIVEGDFTETGGYSAMKNMLPAKPDAVFVASDTMTIGAIRAAREAELNVPDDIAFVSFDDEAIAKISDVQLTTIRQPVEQLGITALELLIDVIKNGTNPPRHIIMDTELVIRDSCGAKQFSPQLTFSENKLT
ncbi:MAG: LacI family DNA-binding transcriptional regulator [Anaerolineales bacterium]|nr:LacI family DNA-binding transcriptional regulator [Chloroflexota bacterium]MBL6982797.1 LacI family DNA-binding transcriptional regulator [Anaerolineales bacterium]